VTWRAKWDWWQRLIKGRPNPLKVSVWEDGRIFIPYNIPNSLRVQIRRDGVGWSVPSGVEVEYISGTLTRGEGGIVEMPPAEVSASKE